MTDTLTHLSTLRRPPLLVEAARIGLTEYRREPALRRHLGIRCSPTDGRALGALMEIEREHDDRRRRGDAGYSPARHVEVMIAVMGEARLMRAARR